MQYIVGGMVTFLEANNVPELLTFYKKNQFKQFNVRYKGKEYSHKLIQFLRLIKNT